MTAKRYTIKPQDDLFGVVDNYSPDKVCVINGIRTEIEAEWLCKDMNALNDENEQLKRQVGNLEHTRDFVGDVCADCERLEKENEQLKSNVIDLIDKKINKLKNINEVSLIPRESVEILKELKKELEE